MRYDHHTIERKWQERWAREHPWRVREDSGKPKCYLLIEFPYPSGEGLHVGHLRSYTAMDIIARKRRMEGYEVLYPIGWDAFGLPAEHYALKTGQHPRITTEANIANFRRQLQAMGFSFDWSREVNTTDPAYYKWTQWIFLQLLKHGLAYKATMPINWCPSCKIGLANEEAVGGVCERCGGPVEKRDKEQWMLKITAYAEKLLEGLEHVDYIERAKVQQRNWIGRSEGAEIGFQISNFKFQIPVFTTRPDTLFGATYLVLAPEHAAISNLKSQISNWSDVEAYSTQARQRTDIERTAAEKEKTGIELKGIRAVNPANGEEIPVWIADYVLAHYGTGAIMAVPAHDERDFTFAQKYGLPVRQVVRKIDAPIRSYVMGAAYITEEDFSAIGVVVDGKTEEGNYRVEIPRGREQAFEDLMRGKMAFGFWNEYVGDETVFLFKHKDGHVERLVLDTQNVERIDQLACEFNNEMYNPSDPGNYINGALARNEWYRPLIVHSDPGVLMNSETFTGMASEDAKRAITEAVGGEMTVTYKLRDWVFSRQRYWGEPIPVVFCGVCGTVPVPEDQLPIELPNVEKYQPTDTGESPLAAITDWVNTKCPRCGGPAKRETDVMPNWAGSSWYFLAYAMRGNSKSETRNPKLDWDQTKLAYWMPVDWYNGGMEHTTLHLLYSRFWYQFLYDIGAVPTQKRNQVSFSDPYAKRTSHGMILAADGEKMSKSRGNVVNPDEIIREFGADAVRVYEMFIGPFDQPVPWSTDGLVGCRRFLERAASLAERVDAQSTVDSRQSTARDGTSRLTPDDSRLDHLLHKTIKKVSEDIEAMRFNTAVSAMMEFTNALGKEKTVPGTVFETFLTLLAPFAPHLTEALWEQFQASGDRNTSRLTPHASRLSDHPWPSYDPALLAEDEVDLIVQVNGKVRATMRVPKDITEADATVRALAEPNVARHLAGKEPTRIVFVPGKLVSIVVE